MCTPLHTIPGLQEVAMKKVTDLLFAKVSQQQEAADRENSQHSPPACPPF
jgi:hypothetical protein